MSIKNTNSKKIDNNIELAMKNARASIVMEGLTGTYEMDELCKNFLEGKYSIDECINIFISTEKRS